MADEALTEEEMAVVVAFRQQQENGASPEEAAARAAFSAQMQDPDAPQTVSVVNESLGKLMDGTKIQFRGDKPGWKPEPAPKGYARWAAREARRLEATAAAKARAQKNHKSVFVRVEEAAAALKGRNVSDSIKLIELQSPAEREAYILAEELNDNRVGVLRNPGFSVSNKFREAYISQKQTIEEINSEDPVEELIPAE